MKPGSILNYIRKVIIKYAKYLITGAGIRAIFRDIWKAFWKEIDRIIGFFAREIYKKTVKINPKKVFFFTQEMRYGCNPKYICEELLNRNLDIEVVWRLHPNGGRGDVPTVVKGVRAGTFEYYKELYSSAIIVANSYIFLDQILILKKEQTLIQTWHGSLGIKKFGKNDMKGHRRQRMASILTGKMTDYCVTNSTFVSSSLKNTYWPHTPMLEYGHPRNDIFYEKYSKKRQLIKKEFISSHNLDEDVHFVMYAPTFRDNKDFSPYGLNVDDLLLSLEDKFGGKWSLLLRYHPSMLSLYKEKNFIIFDNSRIIDVSNFSDMQELLTIVDVGITDYSSWIYDFMLQKKPGFIFATDIDAYDQERGFCYPITTTPFEICKNNNDLKNAINNFDKLIYSRKIDEFLESKGCVEDGKASVRVVDKIIELIETKYHSTVNERVLYEKQ